MLDIRMTEQGHVRIAWGLHGRDFDAQCFHFMLLFMFHVERFTNHRTYKLGRNQLSYSRDSGSQLSVRPDN
jgi:hypothetical protein